MKVWVTRDDDRELNIDMWLDEPRKDIDLHYRIGNLWACWEQRDFKKMFGFTPRKGSCKQYELSLKEIK